MLEMIPFNRRSNRVENYNPFRELAELEKRFFGGNEVSSFRTDIRDNGDSYLLEAELPGFKREDLNVSVDGDYLTVSAERHAESEEKDKRGNYLRCERTYGSFSRSFDISEVNSADITAEYTDGILRLTMPKKVEPAATARKLEIK